MLGRRSFLLHSAAAFVLAGPVGAVAAPRPTRRTVQGPGAPVEIVDDVYGVPHIRAGSIPDAFFGQGYATARDRLFQIDFGHRSEMGLMADAFGPDFVRADALQRLFHYPDDLDAELARVPADVRAAVAGYVAGVNARIDEVTADPTLLPLEYRILGVAPLRWDVRDLVRARGASAGNAGDGIRRAQLAALGLLDLDAIVAPLHPAHPITMPAGLDVAAVSPADLGVLRRGALPFGPATHVERIEPSEPEEQRLDRGNAGSNAWTIASARSATGRPILANDPHLGIGGWGPRYVCHLTAPGLDVIGGGAPGLPGIMQGHTDRFAFGRTNFHIDQEDLFVLQLHPDDPERYRHNGGWQAFRRVEAAVPVKGGAVQTVVLRYSVQGPVVSHDPARRRATALGSIAMQPGGFGGFAMVAINLARDWAGLARAFALHPAPTNFHYADTAGNTGWQAIGFVPRRKSGQGLTPVPGDGRFDWRGYDDFRSLPGVYNPPAGWFASANQDNLPPGWPADRVPGFDFRDPYRYDRIADILSQDTKQTLPGSVALQHDTRSTPALAFVALLPAASSPGAAAAARMLRAWDGRLERDSAAAALFEIVWREAGRRMLAAIVPERAKALVTSIAVSSLLDLLARPDARLGGDPEAARDTMLDAALATGWASATALFGPDPASWRWGQLHTVRIAHPLARIPAIAAAFPSIDGGASGGDSYTVGARWLGNGPGWGVGGGASYLQVIDVGGWDNSLWLNLPGQSNDPRSPHYADGVAPWSTPRMLPMLFSAGAVAAHAAARTTLIPAAHP